MGSTALASVESVREGVNKLNDSLFELYRPAGHHPTVDVIFFHGLQLDDYRQAFWKNWLSRDETVIWPQAWLGPDLQTARIFSVVYDSSVKRRSNYGRWSVKQIVENLILDIILSPSGNIGQNRPVILVGHGVGGLIIKQLLVEVKRQTGENLDRNYRRDRDRIGKLANFVGNCKGIFYYSTPHDGSYRHSNEWGLYAARAVSSPGYNYFTNSHIINFFINGENSSTRGGQLNYDFEHVRNGMEGLVVRTIVETRVTTFWGILDVLMVTEPSARAGHPGQSYWAEANHFEVCKPVDQISSEYTFLRNMCADIISRFRA